MSPRPKNGSAASAARARAALSEYIRKGKQAKAAEDDEEEEDEVEDIEILDLADPEPPKQLLQKDKTEQKKAEPKVEQKDPYKDMFDALQKDVQSLKSDYEAYKKQPIREVAPIIKVISSQQKRDDELKLKLLASFK